METDRSTACLSRGVTACLPVKGGRAPRRKLGLVGGHIHRVRRSDCGLFVVRCLQKFETVCRESGYMPVSVGEKRRTLGSIQAVLGTMAKVTEAIRIIDLLTSSRFDTLRIR